MWDLFDIPSSASSASIPDLTFLGSAKFKDKTRLCHPEPLFGEGSPPLRGGILRYAQNDIVFLMLGTSHF